MSKEQTKKILFISHDSSLTGAPILLFNLLNLFKRKSLIEFEIVLYRGGYLESAFKKLAQVDILKSKDYSAKSHLVKRLIKYAAYRFKLEMWRMRIKRFDLIFSNTITNGRLLKTIRKNIPIISYVHELESVIQQNETDAFLTFKYSNIIAVPSQSVADNLKQKHHVPEDKIVRLDYFFPMDAASHPSKTKLEAQTEFLKKYNLPVGKLYVVSMGTATYRKGIDLFVEVAKELQSHPEIFHIWIGDYADQATKEKISEKIKNYALDENFFLTGFVEHSQLNLMPFDIFLLTSREDPYPLVLIEAALNEVPTIGFKSGGISEFIGKDCGWIVDSFSPKNMAKKILELNSDPDQIILAGKKAYRKAIELHSNEERVISQFNHIIQKAYE